MKEKQKMDALIRATERRSELNQYKMELAEIENRKKE